jgi:hypothetical protein
VGALTSFQRQTGIKDSIAQPLLDQIIKRRQALQQQHLKMPEITQKLRAEFSARGASLTMNPLLSVPGEPLGVKWSGNLIFFPLGLDIHIDTPTETLHTILLGVVKYLWGQAMFVMDKGKSFERFAARLRCIAVNGLQTGPVPDYILTNRGSLNGKHFKVLVQTAIFCLYGLVSADLFNCWYTLGRLTVLLWYSSIRNVDAYIVSTLFFFFNTSASLSPNVSLGRAASFNRRLVAHARKMFPMTCCRQRQDTSTCPHAIIC